MVSTGLSVNKKPFMRLIPLHTVLRPQRNLLARRILPGGKWLGEKPCQTYWDQIPAHNWTQWVFQLTALSFCLGSCWAFIAACLLNISKQTAQQPAHYPRTPSGAFAFHSSFMGCRNDFPKLVHRLNKARGLSGRGGGERISLSPLEAPAHILAQVTNESESDGL